MAFKLDAQRVLETGEVVLHEVVDPEPARGHLDGCRRRGSNPKRSRVVKALWRKFHKGKSLKTWAKENNQLEGVSSWLAAKR